LSRGVAVSGAAVRQETILAVSPKPFVQRLARRRVRRLNDDAQPFAESGLQEVGQRGVEAAALQMVEAEFRQITPPPR
jgi:hypothetical protein